MCTQEHPAGQWRIRAIVRLVLLMLPLWPSAAMPSVAQSPSLTSKWEDSQDKSSSTLYVTLKNCEIATVTLTGTGKNFRSSVRMPATVEVRGSAPVPLATFFVDDPRQAWRFDANTDFMRGPLKTGAIAPFNYALPYPDHDQFTVIQGFFGTYSHQRGTYSEYAIDFGLPSGTPVRAARAGRVNVVKEDSNIGGGNKRFLDDANYIDIVHDDGTYAEYCHLMLDGAVVKVGDVVKQGQLIGYSGSTGFAAGPHLHFVVFENVDGKIFKSLPIKFQTADGVVVPQEGRYY